MVAKLVFFLVVLTIIVVAATAMAFWYFNEESERQHEKDLQQMDHTERVLGVAEDESSIDAQLEREKEND